MKLKKAIKKNPISVFTILVLCLLLLVSAFFNLKNLLTEDHTAITDDSIREEIVPVARLAVYDYNFTQVLALTESGNILNWENPITTKRYVATIDGSVPIEVDAELITVATEYLPTGAVAAVEVRLPHCNIGKVALAHDTLKEYVSDNGWFNINPVTTVDLNSLEAQIQIDQREKLENSDVLEKADERVKELISAQIKGAHGEDVDVSFDYIDIGEGETSKAK